MSEKPPVDVEIPDTSTIFEQIIDGVVGRVLDSSDARIVYGEPTTQGDCTVIPVARISTGFGFGGGSGQGTSEDGSLGGGSGGGVGGKIEAKPVGYIEMTPDGTEFVPIQDTTAIAIRALTFFGICAVVIAFGVARGRRGS